MPTEVLGMSPASLSDRLEAQRGQEIGQRQESMLSEGQTAEEIWG